MRDGTRIIDIDTHVVPALEIIKKYADDDLLGRWGELDPYVRLNTAPRPDLGDYEHQSLVLSVAPYTYDRTVGEVGVEKAPIAGGKDALSGRVLHVLADGPEPGVMHDNSAGRLRSMDREGIDVDLIIPGTFANASTHIDTGIAQLLCESYNRYIVDYCAEDPERLRATLLVVASDAERAASVVKQHAGERCIAAVTVILPEGLVVDHPSLQPIWEAMNEHDLPILHHSFFYEPPYFPGYRDIWGNVVIARAAAHPWGAQRLLSYVMLSGLFDRYPNLRIGFAEVGAGWLPFWLRRLDAQADYMRNLLPPLKRTCVEYAQDGRIFSGLELYEGPELLQSIIDVLGDGIAMYQSDFPHPQCRFPDSPVESLAWDWGALGEGDSTKAKFYSGNAETYLRLL